MDNHNEKEKTRESASGKRKGLIVVLILCLVLAIGAAVLIPPLPELSEDRPRNLSGQGGLQLGADPPGQENHDPAIYG